MIKAGQRGNVIDRHRFPQHAQYAQMMIMADLDHAGRRRVRRRWIVVACTRLRCEQVGRVVHVSQRIAATTHAMMALPVTTASRMPCAAFRSWCRSVMVCLLYAFSNAALLITAATS